MTAADFRQLLDVVPDAMVVVGDDGRIRFANAHAVRLFGFPEAELVNETIEKLIPERFHASHAGHRQRYHQSPHARPIESGLDLFGRRKDGSEFPAEVSLAPVAVAEGRFITAAIRDVTERRRLEKVRLQHRQFERAKAIDARERGVWKPVAFSVVAIALAAALRWWPLQSLGSRLAWVTFYPAVMISASYGALAGGLLSLGLALLAALVVLPATLGVSFVNDSADVLGMGVFALTCVIVSLLAESRRRGRARSTAASEALDASNQELQAEIVRRGKVEQDVTRLNRELERTAVELRETNRELEAFSYSVAHDLRAPLRSMDGFAQALLEDYADKLDDEGRRYLGFVRESAQRMAQLIDDLLSLSRVTRAELLREKVDMSALAEAAVGRLRRAQPERVVDVVVSPGVQGEGDPRLLAVILENLIGNAWKFTAKREGARIEFGATEKGGVPVFLVRDNGAGFDMAHSQKLFGVFQRLHPVSDYEGTGVGLAIVQRIVRRHGGRVWAEAAPNQGASFYFTLEEEGMNR